MNDYKTFAIGLAEKASVIMRRNFIVTMEKMEKEDMSLVTKSDIEINRLVIDSIMKRFPTHSILGEEESHLIESEFVWVCDPIDGTHQFAHGIPLSTFELALTQNGIPILGVVCDPFMKRMFFAQKGQGAFMNNKTIGISQTKKLGRSVVITEMSQRFLYNIDSLLPELSKKGSKTFKLGCFSYGGMLVAGGQFTAAVFGHTSAWDVAGVKIIIEEAGGKCTDFQGNDQRYDQKINGFVASNGLVHDELISLLAKFAVKNTLKTP